MTTPTRRTVLRTSAVTALAAAAVARLPSRSATAALATSAACATLTPELTQGPFWVDERLERRDVRADSETGAVQSGVPLTLTIRLQDAGASCTPQSGAFVDIWHANAQGAYSDVSGQGNPDNVGVDWLRGYQVSDADGSVTFTTIWPGWYTGRTVHVHVRVRLALDADTTVDFTSQLFFEESANAAVLATSPYLKSGTRMTNAQDGLFDASLVVPVTGSPSAGYAGSFTAALDFGDGGTEQTGADQKVRARVVAAVVRRRRGRRVLEVRLRSRDRVTGRLRLVRHDDVLARRRWGWLAPGARTLRVAVPKGVEAGPARLVLTLADEAGNARIVRKRVEVLR